MGTPNCSKCRRKGSAEIVLIADSNEKFETALRDLREIDDLGLVHNRVRILSSLPSDS